jgi:transcriptional regulator with XRE-family HTH domain
VDASARGQRIARARRRRGLSQAALAGLAGRSESWLSQVERGLRQVDSHSVLMSLAEILRVDVTELTGDEPSDPRASQYAAAREIERAMMAYDALESLIGANTAVRAPDLGRLRLGVDRVNRAYQAARYDEAGRMLPALIRGVETAARTCPRRDVIAVSSVRAQVYQATAMVLSRVGETGLAWTAGDRAVTAAEHANAGLLAAVSAFRLAHVFIRRKQAAQAHGLVTGAAIALERSGPPGDPERLSVLGGLHLAGALAAAADFDRAAADRSLSAARRVAERLGADRNDHWTAFGPTNVRIHEVSAAVAFGDASTAVETGETLDLQRLPAGLGGRRSQVSLDLARALRAAAPRRGSGQHARIG